MSSIFLSHSSLDKPFVRKLAADLRSKGFFVWLDEAEIKLGDSLIKKISEGIEQVEYVGVVISKNSIDSEWFNREVEIALNQEISGKKVKILPLLLEKVNMPPFLSGKLYADFTCDENYDKGLKLIIDRLSESPKIKCHLSKEDVEFYKKIIDDLNKQLEVSSTDKRLLLERLRIERTDMPEALLKVIESEKSRLSEFHDINKNYSFQCCGINVTVGYFLHALRKEYIKGAHVLPMVCEINNKTGELKLLAEATLRRLNSIDTSNLVIF